MSQRKKAVREAFRTAVFNRDGHKCVMCGQVPHHGDKGLDAHHITDRHDLPNGGYVEENGITLCEECHIRAELFHNTGVAAPCFSPAELYAKVGSSFEKALAAAGTLTNE